MKGNKKGAALKGSSSKTSSCQPVLIIAMGFPGSGKSYAAASLSKATGFPMVSSDEVGTDGVKKAVEKRLGKGESLIIDRCNIHPNDRKMWATQALAQNANVRLVLFWCDTPVDVCKERVKSRKDHPTLGPDEGDEVIDRFAKGFKAPEDWELRGPKYFLMIRATPDNLKAEIDAVVEAVSVGT